MSGIQQSFSLLLGRALGIMSGCVGARGIRSEWNGAVKMSTEVLIRPLRGDMYEINIEHCNVPFGKKGSRRSFSFCINQEQLDHLRSVPAPTLPD